MTYCIYLTHPEVTIDPETPVPDWGLSEIGRERAAIARSLSFAAQIGHVVSSAERKAIETAKIFADGLALPVTTLKPLHENDRSSTGFVLPEDFEELANKFFADPYVSVRGWERAIDAQMRIVAGVRAALSRIAAETPVLFAGHGGVGTLLMCHLMNTGIDRMHDQKRGGSWYRFEKDALTEQSAANLHWIEL